MNNDIIIIGAGGFGREVLWLIEELNKKEETWNIIGFVDDNILLENKLVNGYPVLGTVEWLSHFQNDVSVVCCIGSPKIRANIISKLLLNPVIKFPNIIADDVKYSDHVKLGKGNIICTSSILTVNINVGDFNIINLDCTIGHDVSLENYVTIYPSTNISGFVNIGNYVEIGTGTQIIQGIHICENTIVGAGGVVVKDISEKGTYVGIPARRI